MATSITDLLTQIKSESESSKKTYADKSDAFEDIFNKVNKNYTRDENDFNAEDKKIDYQKRNDKFEQKEDENKSENTLIKKDSSKNDDKNNNIENNTKIENNEKPLKNDETQKKPDEKEIQEDKTQIKEASEDVKTEPSENKVEQNTNQKKQEPIINQLSTTIAANIKSEAVDVLIKNLQIGTTQNQVQAAPNKLKPQIQTQAQTQTQPQTQQVLLNLKLEHSQQKNSIETVNKTPQKITADVQQLSTDIKTKMPLIQAGIDIKAKGTETIEQKQSIKDFLQKTILTQEMLDVTNAKVTSVEQNTSSNNLLNKQSPQENAIKSLVDSNQQNSQNLNAAEAKINFNKTIENIQTPKELPKSDIMAQIHTKLSEAKDEGSTRVTIVLKPENLGKVNLELINGKDGLIARMTAENVQVKELLEKNLDGLKNSLGAQGIQVNDVNVKVENIEKQSNEMLNFEYQQENMKNEQEQKDSQKAEDKNQSNQNNTLDSLDNSEEDIEETSVSEKHAGNVDYKV